MNKREYIARGIICRRDEILLCKNVDHGHLYLPGGHVEDGESSQEALKREMREESGREVIATRFVTTFENEFTQNGREIQERCDVYLAQLDIVEAVHSKEKHIGFQWISLDQLQTVRFLPEKILLTVLDIIQANRSFW
ncbi:MAG: NUDIX domain-containing protein [Candidatus Paceibacterota bacterium]